MDTDISHYMGQDLSLGPTGDLAPAVLSDRSQQRILRRLLTNAAAYIWELPYGGGLPQFIGQPVSAPDIAAVIRGQMALEDSVLQNPPPTVDVQSANDTSVFVTITYTDADSGQTVILDTTQMPVYSPFVFGQSAFGQGSF